MKTLYLDCFSGISGDMAVGALLDLGADRARVLAGLEGLGLPGWRASITRTTQGILAGTAFRVVLAPEAAGGERSLRDIEALLGGAELPAGARDLALRAFRLLGEAEARVHGLAVEEVHFHEVGAVDAIVDLVGAALCLEDLAPEAVVVSPLPMARGFVRCRHGLLPLPAPATLELARGVPVCRPPGPTVRELCTPTGLALVRAVATGFGELPAGVVAGLGHGLGTAELPWPNVLRAVLLEAEAGAGPDRVVLLEANLDDMTGEALAYALDRMLAEGALDAWLAPIVMKKGRPGFTLGVLCAPGEEARLEALMLRETRTLGVRRSVLERSVVERREVTVATRAGAIRGKVAFPPGASPRFKPEFEDCRRAAQACGLPLHEVVAQACQAAQADPEAGL